VTSTSTTCSSRPPPTRLPTRNAYIGDDRYVYVPQGGLLSQDFATERFAQIDPTMASDKPVAPGDPCDEDGGINCVTDPDAIDAAEGASTTHLVTADRWGKSSATR
jgi:gamma-glutamyltranspeptidase/glutathione hydrolase